MADQDQKNRSANIVKEEEKSLKLLVEKNKTLSQTTGLEKDILNKKKEEKTLADKLVDQKNSTIDSLISSAENMSTSIFGGSVGGIINVLMTGKVKTMLKNNRADIEAAKEREKETKLQNDLLVKNRLEKSKLAAEERAYQIEAIKATEARNKKGELLSNEAIENMIHEKEVKDKRATKEKEVEDEQNAARAAAGLAAIKKEEDKAKGGAVETVEKPADTGGGGAAGGGGGATLADIVSTLDFTNELLYDGLFGSPPLLKTVLENQETDLDNQESKEDRRERLRKSGGVAAVVGGGGAGGAGAEADGKGGLLGSVKDILMKSVGLGGGGAAGGGTLSQIGKLGSKFKGLSKSIGGKVAGKVVSGALAQVAAIAMVGKDVFDIASAVTDDDVRTGIKGADVGGVIGGVLGGAIGFAIGGPAGAALGASLGNMAGEFIGEAFDSPEIVGAVQKVKDDLIAEQQTLATDIADINAQLEDTNTSEAMKTLLREQLKQSTARQTAVGEELKVFAEGGELDIANKAVIEAGKKGDALAAQKAKLKAQIDAADEKGDHAKVAFLTTLLTQTEEDFDAAEAAYAIKAEELRKVAQKTSGALAESSTSLMDKLATEGGFFGTILSGVGSVSEFFGGGGIGLKGEAGGKYLEEQFKKLDGKIAEQEALIKSGDDFDWSLEPRTAIIGKLTREKARLEKVKEEKGLARGGFIVNKPTYLPSSGIVVGEHGTYSGRGAADGGIADGGPEAVIPLSSSRSGAFIDPMARSIAGAVMNQLQMERGMMSGGEISNNVITDARSNSTNNNTTIVNNPSPIGQTLPDEGRDFVSKVA